MGTTSAAPHILAIDDDPAMRAVYAELLCEEGYRVTTWPEPPADPAEVAALAPDLIVLDLIMDAAARGAAFLALLRDHPATRALPVVVCTADRHRLEAMEAQLWVWDCALVTKPFDIDDFLAAVRGCLAPEPAELDAAAD
jgi:CheY-like chemotaxis protein